MSAPPDLTQLRGALRGRAILIGARTIREGDEIAFAASQPHPSPVQLLRERASGAARLVARELIAELGGPSNAALPRLPSRAPLWPAGLVGSLAHDDVFAVAAVARDADVAALGIDVEPLEPLPDDIAAFALSERERARLRDPCEGRIAFAAKEAVYKAFNPFDGSTLEFSDIETDLAAGAARLMDGRAAELWLSREGRIVVVASVRRA